MTLKELLNGVDVIESTLDLETQISGVCFDSRKVEKNNLFICLKGIKKDGHDFAKDVEDAGAAALLMQENRDGADRFILVKDTRKALSLIAANWYGRPADKLKLIGITGTNGKTTTSYLLKQILESQKVKVGLIGTIHAMIGDKVLCELSSASTTPEPMELHRLFKQMLDEGAEYVVMEVSSHALVQDRVEGCTFEAGIFTNLTQDHLDFHGNMENYLISKAKLFGMCKIGILNADDDAYLRIMERSSSKNYTYSTKNDNSDVVAKNIKLRPASVEFEVLFGSQISRAELSIPCMFSVYNALGAISAALMLGYGLADILDGLKHAKGVKGRVEPVFTGTDYTVLIDYAHSPDGLENVLSAMRQVSGNNRLVTLFGCGGDRDKTKRPIMGKIAADYSNFVIVTSDNPRTENPAGILDNILVGMKGTKTPYVVIENRREAIKYALTHAKTGDLIVLAGKGHETYQILNTGIIHFDEREVVAEILAELKK